MTLTAGPPAIVVDASAAIQALTDQAPWPQRWAAWAETDTLVFMDTNTGDQIHVEKNKVGDDARWLNEGLDVNVTLFNGNPIGIDLPSSVVMQIVSSEPGIKGDTASGATKPATLATGATVNVPLFIKEGEWIKIDTTSGQYLERVNK